MNPKEIFILEDDFTVRDMLCVVLAKAGYDPICFADGTSLLISARQRHPVCILLDICLPGRSGLEILRELQKDNYSSPVIIISGYGSVQTAIQAGRMGAIDFIEKPFKGSDLIRRIEDATRTLAGITDQQSHENGSFAFPGLPPFTKREQQIIGQILLGKSTKEIAGVFKLSPRTVEDHRSNICSKANVKTTSQLVLAIIALKHQGEVESIQFRRI